MKKKILAAALAAVLVCGSVSAVSFAETAATEESTTGQTWTDEDGITWKNPFEIREEESKYNITLENAVVDGKEKVAVRFSGLTSKVFDAAYSKQGREDVTETGYKVVGRELDITVAIDVGERILCFKTEGENDKFIGALGTFTPPTPNGNTTIYDELGVCDYRQSYSVNIDAMFGNAWAFENGINSSNVDIKLENNGETFDIIAYLDKDDDILKDLANTKDTTVLTYGNWHLGVAWFSVDGIGMGGGFDDFIFEITSDGKIIVRRDTQHYIPGDGVEAEMNGIPIDECATGYDTDDEFISPSIPKEKVKITNNLKTSTESIPETSEPTSSTTSEPTSSDTSAVPPGSTDPVSEPDSSTNEPTVLEATLKNVDSENGLSGEQLDKQLFGDSGWTWAQVEKIVFTSDSLFSVQYTAVDGSTKTLGEKPAQRAEGDGIWNTEWTLDTSLMSKDKSFVKLIAKDGTADIKATIYIKKDAAKPSTGSDQADTGIALAIAPIAFAASAVIVASKKKK